MLQAILITIYQTAALILISTAFANDNIKDAIPIQHENICEEYSTGLITILEAQDQLDDASRSLGAYEIQVEEFCETNE